MWDLTGRNSSKKAVSFYSVVLFVAVTLPGLDNFFRLAKYGAVKKH